jgi:hypothetical protein
VWTLTRLSRLYWRQSLLLIVAVLLPSVANVAHNLNLGPFRHVEPTPFLFVLTGAVLVWGLFRFRLLGLAPIATNVRMHAAATQVAVRLEEAQGGLLHRRRRRRLRPRPCQGHPATRPRRPDQHVRAGDHGRRLVPGRQPPRQRHHGAVLAPDQGGRRASAQGPLPELPPEPGGGPSGPAGGWNCGAVTGVLWPLSGSSWCWARG